MCLLPRLLAQTSLRNILGTKNLHEILSDREGIALAMQVRGVSALCPLAMVRLVGVLSASHGKIDWCIVC